MMRRPRWTRASAVAFAVLGALAVPGCKPSDSILLIEVAGPVDLEPIQLSVTVIAGAPPVGRNLLVPAMPLPGGQTVFLPSSFTLALDRSRLGPVTVSIDALDGQGSTLASGTTMQQHIEIGGQTVLTVMLTVGAPQQSPDAGADGPDAMGLDSAAE